jgi:hypothetical protein
MEIKCVVACRNAEGSSDFYFCKVECSQEEYDYGDHYDKAEDAARDDGYEGPMVAFDENDGPDFLFDNFVWESASVV